jgi:hypothetical protein
MVVDANHTLGAGYPSYEKCEAERVNALRTMKGNAALPAHVSQQTEKGSFVRYLCLPDTVDPRGPKEK